MIKLFLPGQPCPAWLERIEFTGGANPVHRIDAISLLTIKTIDGKRHYHLRPLFPSSHLIYIDGGGASVCVTGQSPDEDGSAVLLNVRPLIGWSELCAIANVCLFVLNRS